MLMSSRLQKGDSLKFALSAKTQLVPEDAYEHTKQDQLSKRSIIFSVIHIYLIFSSAAKHTLHTSGTVNKTHPVCSVTNAVDAVAGDLTMKAQRRALKETKEPPHDLPHSLLELKDVRKGTDATNSQNTAGLCQRASMCLQKEGTRFLRCNRNLWQRLCEVDFPELPSLFACNRNSFKSL